MSPIPQKRVLTLLAVCIASAASATATSVPRITFAELTDNSDLVASGRIVREWTAWDSGHKYIWTHYQLRTSGVHKGAAGPMVEFAEPGGMADGMGMTIAGAVRYSVGDNVMVFLQRMPNGYLRTTGWGQGKYLVDGDSKLHAEMSLRESDLVNTRTARAGNAARMALEGLSLGDAVRMVSLRVAAGKTGAK